ncbi:MAG: HAMP domain-containing sensor histidine kinase [Myxococcota bacterium]
MAKPEDPIQQLAAALRHGASQVAETAQGGVALVFAVGEAGPTDVRLRAAAGFATPEAAREAGTHAAPEVREALTEDPSARCAATTALLPGGTEILPLRSGDALHGALVVGYAEAPSDAVQAAVAARADEIAFRFEHAELQTEYAALRKQLDAGDEAAEKGDEVLRLSEALFAQDIELLRSNEKLGKIERLKNDFIEKMSRELRTPLNHIIEAIISVLTGEDATLSEAAKGALRTALDEGSSFLRTLQNILDLWRIKQSELPVEVQDVNFRELVDEAIFSVQDSLGDKPIRIETEIVEPFPRLRTDLAKLNQVLFLLLDNAAKFTPEGTIQIRGRVEDDRLEMTIEDDGIGICHDDQPYIFDEFYQVDEPSSQKYPGAGLGLTLVRDLVTLLDGEVSLQSDIGHGTTFTVEIPIQTA